MTEVCVAFPAPSAIEAGYEVFVVTDASGTLDKASRDAAWMRMSAAGPQLLNWFAAAAELHRDWRNDVEGFGKHLIEHTPIYQALTTAHTSRRAR